MHFTLISTVALFAASALAQAPISLHQNEIRQCERTVLTFDNSVVPAPWNVIVTEEGKPCDEPLQVLGDFDTSYIEWTPNANLPAGKRVQISVAGSGDHEGWSEILTVQPGSDSCIPKANNVLPTTTAVAAATSTTKATSNSGSGSTDTTTTDDKEVADVVGGVKNAGLGLGNGATSAHVAAPVMALSAIAALAVLAL